MTSLIVWKRLAVPSRFDSLPDAIGNWGHVQAAGANTGQAIHNRIHQRRQGTGGIPLHRNPQRRMHCRIGQACL